MIRSKAFPGFFAGSVLALAGITNCPTGAPSTSLPTGSLQGINANTPTGCQAIDLQFSGFSTVGSINGGGGTANAFPGVSDITMGITGGAVSGNTITPIRATFYDPHNSRNWYVTQNVGGQPLVSVLSYIVRVDNSRAAPATPPASPGMQWSLNSVTLGYQGIQGIDGAGDSVTARTEFCLGAVSVIGCATANYGYVEAAQTVSGTVITAFFAGAMLPPSLTINFSGNYDLIAIRNTFTLARNNGGLVEFLRPFNEFGQGPVVPEPATFGLMAAGLVAVLGAARRRKF
ncbi:MAG: PEP-CTERM sorting domain-containing protein [Bryobacteraceae bacterium]|nr:PEP-CTERM sorting domain-containing protein [Bryobacteraceae bacterium]